jgi:hypothetical protein
MQTLVKTTDAEFGLGREILQNLASMAVIVFDADPTEKEINIFLNGDLFKMKPISLPLLLH